MACLKGLLFLVFLALSVNASNLGRVGWSSTTTTTTTVPPTTGWSETTTTTPGWTTEAPTTPGWSGGKVGGWGSTTTTEAPTTGWTTEPPTIPPGWSGDKVGWGSTTTTEAPTTLGWGPTTEEPEQGGWGPEHQRPASSGSNTANILMGSDLGIVGSGVAAESHQEQIHAQGNSQVPGETSFGVGGDASMWQDGGNYMVSDIDGNGGAAASNTLYGSQGISSDVYGGVIATGTEVGYAQNSGAVASGVGAMDGSAYTNININ